MQVFSSDEEKKFGSSFLPIRYAVGAFLAAARSFSAGTLISPNSTYLSYNNI